MSDVNGAADGFSRLGRVMDYLFGRNALIGIASFMLLAISAYATWSGMHDFIVGLSSASQSRDIGGGLSVSNDFLVAAVTVALIFLMWLALRETFGARRRLTERMITFPLYVFLALWSIGFGYGFWWSLIAGEEATRTSMSALTEDARDAAGAVAARLDAVKTQLDSVVQWSDSQMSREETSGGSCDVASGAGKGPLYNARHSVRDGVASLRDGVVKSWIGPVEADIEQLQKIASAQEGGTTAERQKLFEAAASNIRGRARDIATRSNELGRSTADAMRALADQVATEPGKPGFSCHDATLAQRLRAAANQAEAPAILKLREAAFNEGPAGVANAIKKLWANIGSYAASLIGYVFTGKSSGATTGGDPITGRDMIALLATVGIDLGLLALGILNPPAAGPIRHDGLADAQSELHLPTEQVIRHLSDAMNTAIARAPGADFEWVRRHFIHHNGASYFIIPNLYSAEEETLAGPRKATDEELRALAMNQLAGVLSDLKLIRLTTEAELKKAGKEEDRASNTDLTPFRREHEKRIGWEASGVGGSNADIALVRNHGLLSKAQRTLDIAGWSKTAQSDVEVFLIIDKAGLTPLLTVLNQAALTRPQGLAPGPASAAAPDSPAAAGSITPARLAIEGPPG